MAPVFSKFSQLPIELRFMVWTDVLYYQSDFYDRGLVGFLLQLLTASTSC